MSSQVATPQDNETKRKEDITRWLAHDMKVDQDIAQELKKKRKQAEAKRSMRQRALKENIRKKGGIVDGVLYKKDASGLFSKRKKCFFEIFDEGYWIIYYSRDPEELTLDEVGLISFDSIVSISPSKIGEAGFDFSHSSHQHLERGQILISTPDYVLDLRAEGDEQWKRWIIGLHYLVDFHFQNSPHPNAPYPHDVSDIAELSPSSHPSSPTSILSPVLSALFPPPVSSSSLSPSSSSASLTSLLPHDTEPLFVGHPVVKSDLHMKEGYMHVLEWSLFTSQRWIVLRDCAIFVYREKGNDLMMQLPLYGATLSDYGQSTFKVETKMPTPMSIAFRETDDLRFFEWFNAILKQKIIIEESMTSLQFDW